MNELSLIEPKSTVRRYSAELWRHRELFGYLAWRDIIVRYKQTVLGWIWAVLRPFVTMVVFTVIFGKLAKFPSGNAPYPILVFAALLPWQLFATSLTEAGNSLVGNAHIVSKVYFPRIILPAASVMVCLVDFLISFCILVLLMVYYGFAPGIKVLLIFPFLLLVLLTAMGATLWVSPLNVRYRDFRYLIPFVVQFGAYVSPIGYATSVIPEKWRLVYSLNPMVGVIEGFRWAIIGGDFEVYWPGLGLSVGFAVILFFSGLWFFMQQEQYFADVI